MSKRNLLLCFDAFGTLFKPKDPIPKQYTEVARQYGLHGFSEVQVQAAFRHAYKTHAKAHPNFGKAAGMGAQTWWTNVIHDTFRPLIGPEQKIPDELAPRLIYRFDSDEGYTVAPQLPALLRSLKESRAEKVFDRVVIGVITNSDDRVPDILSAFGLRVSPLRYGAQVEPRALAGKVYDVDFHCMSYDVGYEKPDEKMFLAAEDMLRQVVTTQDGKAPDDIFSWERVYVGDDYEKDVVGAINAGWHALFFDPDGDGGQDHLQDLRGVDAWSISQVLAHHAAMRVNSIQSVVDWVIGRK